LRKLQHLLQRGLERTAHLWPEILTSYAWVHQAAHLLANHEEADVFVLRRAYRGLLAEMGEHRETEGLLGEAVRIFRKVTRSYWPGLFACYQVPDLPHTNNDLEHFFGSARYHERRATGRKLASPATVVRGSVRLVAAVATRTMANRTNPADPRPSTRNAGTRAVTAINPPHALNMAASTRVRLYDGVEVRLHLTDAAHWGSALLRHTGSAAHLARLTTRSGRTGEDALLASNAPFSGEPGAEAEAAVYAALGLEPDELDPGSHPREIDRE